MSKISLKSLHEISSAAKSVIDALAGNNDEVHPGNSGGMCELYDQLNDQYAPPAVVKSMADEIINLREINARFHAERVADRRRFSNPVPAQIIKLAGNMLGDADG
ncbi:hypothetical protein [Erwinia rhapontici]|uniref:hypothetical protein n=1 Tax=Erwinia rhapontici TaxID=55212 RepID=UPI0021680BD0|nr:hypothetical protein [Erwinia rhapontici]MCS3605282.1 hypothetical protein [Erwinia rhapontici]